MRLNASACNFHIVVQKSDNGALEAKRKQEPNVRGRRERGLVIPGSQHRVGTGTWVRRKGTRLSVQVQDIANEVPARYEAFLSAARGLGQERLQGPVRRRRDDLRVRVLQSPSCQACLCGQVLGPLGGPHGIHDGLGRGLCQIL